jgi:hypothetical protein
LTHYNKNFVTDFDAELDGVTESAAAFEDWIVFLKTLTAGDTVTLTIPNEANGGPDNSTYINNGQGPNFDHRGSLVCGILGGISVTINIDPGVIIDSDPDQSYSIGYWRVTFDDNQHSSRIDTTVAGSSTIQLKTPAEYTRYPVLSWVIICGIDSMQSGQPQNPLVNEKRQITAVDGDSGSPTYGRITLSAPVSRVYKDTWPEYNAGTISSIDEGGPATIIGLPAEYDVQTTFNCGAGVVFGAVPGSPRYYKCRSVVFNGDPADRVLIASYGLQPTIADSTTLNDCINGVTPGVIEFDKMYGTVIANNTVFPRVKVQTAVGEVRLTDCTVELATELAKTMYLTNHVTDTLRFGPIAFGFCDELHLDNVEIVDDSHLGIASSWCELKTDLGYIEWVGDGVISYSGQGIEDHPARVQEPGLWAVFAQSGADGRRYGVPFKVLDSWYDGDLVYIQTTLQEWPTFDMGASGFAAPSILMAIPCLKVYATGVTSPIQEFVSLNNAPQGRPFLEYDESTFSGAQSGSAVQSLTVHGELVKIVVDVTTPYTGAQGSCTLDLCVGGMHLMQGTTYAREYARPAIGSVNLKVAGTRTIRPSGVTNAQSGDSLIPVEGWAIQGIGAGVITNTTGDDPGEHPEFTIKIYTRQIATRTFTCNFV